MSEYSLELTAVGKRYPLGQTQVAALSAVSLAVAKGEMTALVGPSGSGKSTLLNLCGLLDAADEGRIAILGQDIAGMDARARTLFRRRTLGFIFQTFNLIPVMSAYENIEYPLLLLNVPTAERRRQVNAILERVGLAAHAHHRPDRLSGGQRQRVAVARALVKRPGLVIADEPTASLDSATAAHIVEMMKELSQETGTTFLVATHDVRMADHCGRRIELVDGRVQA